MHMALASRYALTFPAPNILLMFTGTEKHVYDVLTGCRNTMPRETRVHKY